MIVNDIVVVVMIQYCILYKKDLSDQNFMHVT